SGLCPQHQMGEIDVPRMRRHVGTLRHEAHVAQIAVVYDFPKHLLVHAVDFAGIGGVDRVEQCWKCVTEAEAAATAVADIEDPLELLRHGGFVVERRIAPVQRMPRRRFQATFPSTSTGSGPCGGRAHECCYELK